MRFFPIHQSPSSSPFPFILFFFLLIIPSISLAQLFLPSSHRPRSLSSSATTECDCPRKARHHPHPNHLPADVHPHRQFYFQQQQKEETRRMKALVNSLNNGPRRKPKNTSGKKMIMANFGAVNESLLVEALRGMAPLLKRKINRKEAEAGKKMKKKKGAARSGGMMRRMEEGEEGGRSRRAKRMSDDDGNSVIDEPLAPPPTNNEGNGKMGRCNSERIRRIIRRAKGRDLGAIKRNVQMMAERQLGAKFNVICASDDFSYISNTEEYCQDQAHNGHTCYVFRQLERRAEEDDEIGEDGIGDIGAVRAEVLSARQFGTKVGGRRRKGRGGARKKA